LKEEKMPIVQISLLQGRTQKKKEELIKKVTDAMVETLQISKDRVHIVLNEVPRENIGEGGIPLSQKDL
jgi:4-oxalocrotonate tautomerase